MNEKAAEISKWLFVTFPRRVAECPTDADFAQIQHGKWVAGGSPTWIAKLDRLIADAYKALYRAMVKDPIGSLAYEMMKMADEDDPAQIKSFIAVRAMDTYHVVAQIGNVYERRASIEVLRREATLRAVPPDMIEMCPVLPMREYSETEDAEAKREEEVPAVPVEASDPWKVDPAAGPPVFGDGEGARAESGDEHPF